MPGEAATFRVLATLHCLHWNFKVQSWHEENMHEWLLSTVELQTLELCIRILCLSSLHKKNEKALPCSSLCQMHFCSDQHSYLFPQRTHLNSLTVSFMYIGIRTVSLPATVQCLDWKSSVLGLQVVSMKVTECLLGSKGFWGSLRTGFLHAQWDEFAILLETYGISDWVKW